MYSQGLARPVTGMRATRGAPRVAAWHLTDRRFASRPSHPAAKALFAYWQSRCTPAGMPRRDDIIAAQIPRLLPHLAILEPVGDHDDWRFRLFGTLLAWRLEAELTGKRVREIYDLPTANALIETYDKVACDRRPAFIVGRASAGWAEDTRYEGAVLPILGRDGATAWVLIGTFFNN